MNTLLNHLDMVALGFRKGIFQHGPMTHLYLGLVTGYYLEFLPIIEKVRRSLPGHLYCDPKGNAGIRHDRDSTWHYLVTLAQEWLQHECLHSPAQIRNLEAQRRLSPAP